MARPGLRFAALAAVCLVLRVPHLSGPLDLRFDAGVYYTLGTSLAEGKGYRMLSEPGEIRGVLFPPLLPAVAAAHQLVMGTSDPDIVGHALRWTFFVIFTAYVLAVFWMASAYLTDGFAFVAALIVAFHFMTNRHAEYFVAELPFGLASTLFFGLVGRDEAGRGPSPDRSYPSAFLTGLLAVAAFLLRTAGVTLLAVWAAAPLRRRRFGPMALRTGLAAGVVLAWQAYIGWVKRQPEYAAPAYAYQHAPYQYYNIPYADGFMLINRQKPELGRFATLTDLRVRVGFALEELASGWGESVSIDRRWYAGEIAKVNRMLGRGIVPPWLSDVATMSLTLLILAGFVLLAARGAWLISCYTAMTVSIFTLFPAPGSLDRYLASLAPLSAVALLSVLAWVPRRLGDSTRSARIARTVAATIVAVVLVQEAYTLRKIFRMLYYPATWVDSRGRQRAYDLYAFDRPWRLHTAALTWLRRQSAPGEIIVTSTPHLAYLITGRQAVQPPWEPDPVTAEHLLESVPATYLVIDQLVAYEPAASDRRYTLPILHAFPSHWRLVYAGPDSGSRIYRQVRDSTAMRGAGPGMGAAAAAAREADPLSHATVCERAGTSVRAGARGLAVRYVRPVDAIQSGSTYVMLGQGDASTTRSGPEPLAASARQEIIQALARVGEDDPDNQMRLIAGYVKDRLAALP
jgi:hypothetical protein